MYALAVAAILACDDWPRVRWARVLGAGVLVGLAAAVRVGGIVLFGFALVLWLGTPRPALGALRGAGLARPARPAAPRSALGGRGGRRLDGDGRLLAVGDARPAAQPLPGGRALRAVLGGHAPPLRRPAPARPPDVSRFYLPNWFALTLPELYLVAFVLGVDRPRLLLRRAAPSGPTTRLQAPPGGLARRASPRSSWPGSSSTGCRSTTACATSCSSSRSSRCSPAPPSPPSSAPRPRAVARLAGLGVLAAACLLTLVDMVRLHPYEAVYFNRLWAGA